MEKDRKPGQNGKGDKSRVTNYRQYRKNFDSIFRKNKNKKKK